MKTFLTLAFIGTSTLAHGAPAFDFNFTISADRFHLEVRQEFTKPLMDVRRGFDPELVPAVSNVVRSAQTKAMKGGRTQVSVVGVKHGLSKTTVNICHETLSLTAWNNNCELDLNSGDTGDTFRSGKETIECKSTPQGASCLFVLDAEVLPQRFLVFSRSAEILALGGIAERLHDQGVLGRMLTESENAGVAKENFESSASGSCIDKVYALYQAKAGKNGFWTNALTVHSKTACK